MDEHYLFFSIIIPAHNEERIIAATLEHLLKLNYPLEKYEVIVVENGSKDRTYETARKFEGPIIKVFTNSIKGVSVAKNTGVEKSNQNTDWVIFLDADTMIQEKFLTNLNTFLNERRNENYVVGTSEIKPLSKDLIAKFWFMFYDIGHHLTKTSYALQIIKYSLLNNVHFDEHLVVGEDLKLIRDVLHYGKFFYFPTKDVYTSTRRFEQEGWLKIFFSWVFVALLPHRLQRHFGYKVIR